MWLKILGIIGRRIKIKLSIIKLRYSNLLKRIKSKLSMDIEKLAEEHNKDYINKTDWRVRKPHVVFLKDNPTRKIVLSNNWVLESDKLETMLDKPNDVAIYSNISLNALNDAIIFHKEEIVPRVNSGFLSKPLNQTKLKKYYDYFEKIITAVVFAYTSIEAFANICIPTDYTYEEEKNGKKNIYNKADIEKTFSLRDKFKKNLPEILDSDNPCEEKWWTRFTELENLRNEIIHSKESKSEERYSKLLSSKIFKKVEVHKEVIEFFGKYIKQNKYKLLDDYPNNFGFDSYKVKLMSKENFYRSVKVIRGY